MDPGVCMALTMSLSSLYKKNKTKGFFQDEIKFPKKGIFFLQ